MHFNKALPRGVGSLKKMWYELSELDCSKDFIFCWSCVMLRKVRISSKHSSLKRILRLEVVMHELC